MTSGFRVDTGAVAQISQKAADSASTIVSCFQKMDSDTQTVLGVCRGTMFGAVTEALTELQAQRNKLIPQLQQLSEQLRKSGQGMDSQSDTAASNVRGVAQSTLSVPMNR
ncbi:MAG TPA: WXG100 family type VII secretion target [Pseudonocardiaceae bacterium]|jgi:uncharacterized protein YukE